MLIPIVHALVEHRPVTAAQMQDALEFILSGQAQEAELAAFLTALRCKGETASNVVAAVQVLRRHAVPLPTGGREVVDTCGTGGDGQSTFNISTTTAFVVAACGVPVVKHGNRGVSSRSGSADVLEVLGVTVDAPPDVAQRCLEEVNLAFCLAPRYHPAVRHVSAVRKRLGFRTLFNLLGPLANPAGTTYQLIGVGDATLRGLLAEAAAGLGMKRAYIVHGAPGLDEVSLCGPTQVAVVQGGQVTQTEWHPEDFGLPRHTLEQQTVPDAAGSAAMLQRVLAGEPGPALDLVLANAAAVLHVCGRVPTLREGVDQAREGIRSGKAKQTLARLREITAGSIG